MNQAVAETIRSYVLATFLEGEDPSLLENDTALISSGVINSLGLMKLVAFLESTFHLRVKAHQMNADHLNTVAAITHFVTERQVA